MDIRENTTIQEKEAPRQDIIDEMVMEPISVTWSPSPMAGVISPEKQFTKHIAVFQKLKRLCVNLVISPELNLNGNIHYHMLVVLKNWKAKAEFYKWRLPEMKSYGFVQVKACDNMLGWLKYMSKDTDLMSAVLEIALPITLKHDIYKKIKKKKITKETPKYEGNIISKCDALASDSSDSD